MLSINIPSVPSVPFLLSNGNVRNVVRFNNGATTPPIPGVMETVVDFMTTYSAYARGAGPLATLTVAKVDAAISNIREFLGVRSDHSLLFSQNSSVAINWLVRLLRLTPSDVIITSDIEHTSNYLPWVHSGGTVVTTRTYLDGSLDYDDFEAKIRLHSPSLRAVALTGASNMSGYIPDLDRVSATVRKYSNALLFVDAAQLAPHRPINMAATGVDALVLSAHKLYAPFGLGVLVVPTSLLSQMPVDVGGGSVDMVSDAGVVWASPNIRHQVGSWNTPGIVALAAACQSLRFIGFDELVAHEQALAIRLVKGLVTIPGVVVHVPATAYVMGNRTATVPFSIEGMHHDLVAAKLADAGIETRAGTICSHRLVRRWLGITEDEQLSVEQSLVDGNFAASYGVVRASLACFNTVEEVDYFLASVSTLDRSSIGKCKV